LTQRLVSLVVSVLAIIIAASLVGCGAVPSPVPSTLAATTPPEPTITETPTRRPSPTATETPLPTQTPTPSPTPTATPTSTPTPLHPMSIAYMRRQSYPGSDLVIEETLAPGATYDRYVASYQSEGLTIYGLLTVPRGEVPESGWPVIVFNHGYIPPNQYRTTERYVAYQDGFARSGYITLKPDYRGHGQSEGAPTGGSRSPDYTVDVLNAVSSLQRYPDADPERVGMWGHSMGGGITLRIMVVTDDVKAGVLWAGVVATFEEIYEARPRWMGARNTPTPGADGTVAPTPEPEGLFAYGTFDENPAFWAAIDPVYHLSDLSGPIQLHHGTADHSVPLDFSEKLHARLQAAGQSAELYVYEGDNHNLSASFAVAMQRSVAFFDEHVKGTPAE
jgi:dipeptidyl aminopeptidase/acylaminoacyl peptidase